MTVGDRLRAWRLDRQARRLERQLGRIHRPPEIVTRKLSELAAQASAEAERLRTGT